jgi:predicted phage terminase large subunit-like protein
VNDVLRKLKRLKKGFDGYRVESYDGPRDLGLRSVADLVLIVSGDDPTSFGPTRRPLHLAGLCSFLDEACEARKRYRLPDGSVQTRQLRSWFSYPIRHFKTSTLRHGVLKHLLRWPDHRVLWCSYNQETASEQSQAIRSLALRSGLRISDERGRIGNWQIEGREGGLLAVGTQQGVAGKGFRLAVVDDPFPDLASAESAAERERLWRWLDHDVASRLSPDGAIVLVHSRWHPDDLIGRLQRETPELLRRAREENIPGLRSRAWRGVNVPALGGKDEDRPLMPDVWSLDHLRAERAANPSKFASLYQGVPRSREGTLFREPTFQDEVPSSVSVAWGVDLAYSAKKSADWSVLVKLLSWTETDPVTGRPVRVLYVADVLRKQVDAPAFAALVEARLSTHRGKVVWIASGTERGTAQFVRQRIPSLVVRTATEDKYQRALPASELWNSGRLRVPSDESRHPWLKDFLYEVTSFSGKNDPHDDQVDALAAAVSVFRGSSMAEALASFAARQREGGDGWAPPVR